MNNVMARDNDQQFAASVRRDIGDLTELRESLKAFGWHPELPAIKDERGAVLIGNRRLKIAEEEGIEPVVKVVTFGEGSEADAERIKLALVSNIGGAPFSPNDRKRIAEYLYGEREWTMQRIGGALGVDKATISRDLVNCCGAQQSKPTKTPTNPKGAGRPKGSGRPAGGPKPERRKNPEMAEIEAATLVLDQGKSYEQAANETGVGSVQVVKTAVAREQGRREGPARDPDTFAKTTKAEFDRALKDAIAKARIEIKAEIEAEIRKLWDEIYLPHHLEKVKRADRIVEAYKGIMSKQEYNSILRCLHPDQSASAEKISDAFKLFKALEPKLVRPDENDKRPLASGLPNSVAEMMARKAAAAEERRARRTKGATR